VLVGCGRVVVHTSPSMSLVVVCGPSTPYVSLVSKLSSACIINKSCQNISIIISSNEMNKCHIYNNQTPIVHSLTRSGVQGVASMPLHPRGPKSYTLRENQVNNTCLCQCNKITYHHFTMPHNHNQMPKTIIIWMSCEQESSENKFAECAQEQDATVARNHL
jgi:hypothetical protein